MYDTIPDHRTAPDTMNTDQTDPRASQALHDAARQIMDYIETSPAVSRLVRAKIEVRIKLHGTNPLNQQSGIDRR